MYAFLCDVVEYKYKVSYTVNKVHIIIKKQTSPQTH